MCVEIYTLNTHICDDKTCDLVTYELDDCNHCGTIQKVGYEETTSSQLCDECIELGFYEMKDGGWEKVHEYIN
jgi:hypothetical protein